jgi:hypothetical protein
MLGEPASRLVLVTHSDMSGPFLLRSSAAFSRNGVLVCRPHTLGRECMKRRDFIAPLGGTGRGVPLLRLWPR